MTFVQSIQVKKHSIFALKISLPYLAVIISQLIWGINFIVAKLTLTIIPPMTLAFLRFFLASILFIPFVMVQKDSLKVNKKDILRFLLVGIFMITFNISLFFIGLTKTTVTSASIITLVIPILSVLTGWTFLKERIYMVNLVGIVIGLIGALFLLELPSIAIGNSVDYISVLGDILIFLSSVSFVIGATLARPLLKKYTTLTLTFVIFIIGSITFAVPAVVEYQQNPSWISHITFFSIVGVIYTVLLSSITAYFLFEWALEKIGIIKADLFQYIQPLIATTLGVILLGEDLHYSYIIGGILIGLGSYWGTLGKEKHKLHKAHKV